MNYKGSNSKIRKLNHLQVNNKEEISNFQVSTQPELEINVIPEHANLGQ